jgi:hypothetical protein
MYMTSYLQFLSTLKKSTIVRSSAMTIVAVAHSLPDSSGYSPASRSNVCLPDSPSIHGLHVVNSQEP